MVSVVLVDLYAYLQGACLWLSSGDEAREIGLFMGCRCADDGGSGPAGESGGGGGGCNVHLDFIYRKHYNKKIIILLLSK